MPQFMGGTPYPTPDPKDDGKPKLAKVPPGVAPPGDPDLSRFLGVNDQPAGAAEVARLLGQTPPAAPAAALPSAAPAQTADGSPLNIGTGGSFLGAKAPAGNTMPPPAASGMPTPLTPDQYNNNDLWSAVGSGFDQGAGQRIQAANQSPEFGARQQQASDLLKAIRGYGTQPGEDASALDYLTRWSQQKNYEAAQPNQGATGGAPQNLTIQNGVGGPASVTQYSPNATTGKFLGAPVTDPNDPDVSRFLGAGTKVQGVGGTPTVNWADAAQRQNANLRRAAGLPEGGQPLGQGPDGKPLPAGSPQSMQEAVMAGGVTGVNPNVAAQTWQEQNKNDLLRLQMDKGEEEEYRKTYQAEIDKLDKAPVPKGSTPLSMDEKRAQAQRASLDALKSYRDARAKAKAIAGGSDATVPTTNPGGGQDTNIKNIKDKIDQIGPVNDWLNNAQLNTGGVWANILRHDAANPGFMQQHGQDVINAFKKSRGGDALETFLNPGLGGSVSNFIGGLGRTDYSDEEKAAAALRQYLGFNKPNSAWGRMFGRLGIGDMDPQAGIAPIPGSPGAK